MASTTDFEMTPERFTGLVDTYGGDIGRWPAAVQATARAHAVNDSQAARQLAEAQAFDRLLGLAPATAASPELVERILARAGQQPQASAPSAVQAGSALSAGNVIPLPQAQPRRGSSAGKPPHMADGWPGSWRLPRGQAAGAGGMLAASLLIGIWLGASGAVAPTLATVLPGRSLSADLDALSEIVQSALPPDLLEGTDEDTL